MYIIPMKNLTSRIKSYFLDEDQAHQEFGEQSKEGHTEKQAEQKIASPLGQAQDQHQDQSSDMFPPPPPGHRVIGEIRGTVIDLNDKQSNH